MFLNIWYLINADINHICEPGPQNQSLVFFFQWRCIHNLKFE